MTTYQVPREFAMGGSYVDETLFGESRAKKTAARRRAASRAGQSMVGKSEEVLKITRQEYEAIKRRANTPLATLQTQQNTSRRKEHRVPIRPLHKDKTTPEQEYERQYRETIGIGGANIRAFNLRNEELDEVKALQSHLQVMKVKAEVDEGLKLKQRRQEQIEAYERQKEREMEEVRLRELQAEAQRNERKRAVAKEAQQALLDQVARQHQMELLEEERVAQENLQMRRHMQQLEEADRQKKVQAQQAQARRNIELAKSNQLAEKYRIIAREQSEKEDAEISQYLRKKAAEQEYRLRQAEKLRQEEELAVARMRELQERHQDKQAEEDAKQARAYQEARQLKEEEELASRTRHRQEAQAEVLRGLEQQKRLKAQRARQERETEAAYADRIRREAREVNHRRDQEERRRHEERAHYKQDLVSLMERREHERREAERQQRESDARDALAGDVYKHRVNLVIKQKLAEHAQQYPVPARYQPGVEEKQAAKKAATQKFHKTRALW